MKKFLLLFLIGIMFSTFSYASMFSLQIGGMHCEKCVQRIRDYFEKNYKQRVQNLNVDLKTGMVTFNSISVDSIELENIKSGMTLLGFKTIGEPVKKEEAPTSTP